MFDKNDIKHEIHKKNACVVNTCTEKPIYGILIPQIEHKCGQAVLVEQNKQGRGLDKQAKGNRG